MNKAKPTLDRKTGRLYPSRNQTGTALAQEFGEPIDNWVWYRVLKKAEPNRFVDKETRRSIPKNSQLGEVCQDLEKGSIRYG